MAAGNRPEQAEAVLVGGATDFGISLSAAQLVAFHTYVEAILFWSARSSLTGATSATAIIKEHIIDSLALAPLVQAGIRVADLGSGAGFPGIPLAIVRPEATVSLVESRRKRASFLREAIRRCGLANVEVIEGRAESLPVGTAFDLVVARAVWSASELLAMAGPLLRDGGRAVAMKGSKGLVEVRPCAQFSAPEVIRYQIHDRRERLLLVFTKLARQDG